MNDVTNVYNLQILVILCYSFYEIFTRAYVNLKMFIFFRFLSI